MILIVRTAESVPLVLQLPSRLLYDFHVNTTPRVALGPFELISPIGKGGMGEVWRAVHVEQRVDVAVKVITHKKARNTMFHDALYREIEAVAKLHHPGIVTVFDVGQVTTKAERLSGKRLLAGGPFLAMELVRGCSLREVGNPMSWARIRVILLSLLDALAHAHARGVVHGDIKPGNVLLDQQSVDSATIKLADFGTAHAIDIQILPQQTTGGFSSTDTIWGTPHYMPPEQLRGRWQDYGPWTDLYALGCMSFQLATGQPPFRQKRLRELMRAHLHSSPPRLATPDSFPRDFEKWVHRLLEKKPQRRFQRAADAAWALRQLRSPESDEPDETNDALENSSWGITRLESATPTLSDITTRASLGLTPTSIEQAEQLSFECPNELQFQAVDSPPLPQGWRRSDEPTPSIRLVGVGLGLYGLRSVPLADRDSERDRIWAALRAVCKATVARLLLLRGPTGVGKSRLAEWICQRAHELGAHVLKAVHGPISGPAHGLSQMVVHHMRCVDLSRSEVLERTEQLVREQGVVDEYEWQALTELMVPRMRVELALSRGNVFFGHPRQRYSLLQRLLQRIGRERPVVVWLDDVQWGSDALSFAEYLLTASNRSACPVLLLLTAQDEALAERPLQSGQVDELLKLDGAEELTIAQLAPKEHSLLVRDLLNLEGSLAAKVEERTAGNPLFAVHLVGDWVRRGVLEVAERGFALKPGENAEIPDDLHHVWTTRLDRLLDEITTEERFGSDRVGGPSTRTTVLGALELAAVLGRDVDADEWEAVCKTTGTAPSSGLVDRLISSNLAVSTQEGGWSFVHGMLRESLERVAREQGRWRAHNRACAEVLRRRYPETHVGICERLGRHLVEARAFDESLNPLLEAAKEHSQRSEYLVAHALLDYRQEALSKAELAESDIRRVEGWVLRAHLHNMQCQYDLGLNWAEKAAESAKKHGWPRIRANALLRIGETVTMRGELTESTAWHIEALTLFRQTKDKPGEAFCLQGLAERARVAGELDRAIELYEEALRIFTSLNDRLGVSHILRGMGAVAIHRGNDKQAKELLLEAQQIYLDVGNQRGVSICSNDLGEAARREGDLDLAEKGYRKSLEINERLGLTAHAIPRLNLSFVLLARGNYPEARNSLEVTLQQLEDQGLRAVSCAAHTALLACLAQAGDWEGWDLRIERVVSLLAETEVVDPDVGWSAHLAGDLALAAGEKQRALKVYEIAQSHWEALGREEESEEVTRQISQIQLP